MVMTLAVVANFLDIAFIVSTYSVFEDLAGNEITSNERLNFLEESLLYFIPYAQTNLGMLAFCIFLCCASYTLKAIVLIKESYFVQSSRKRLVNRSLEAFTKWRFIHILDEDISSVANTIIMRSNIISAQLIRAVLKFHVGIITFSMIGVFICFIIPSFVIAILMMAGMIYMLLISLKRKAQNLGSLVDFANRKLLSDVSLAVRLQRSIRINDFRVQITTAVNTIADESKRALAQLQIIKQSPRILIEFIIFMSMLIILVRGIFVGSSIGINLQASTLIVIFVSAQRMFPVLTLVNNAFTGVAASKYPINEYNKFILKQAHCSEILDKKYSGCFAKLKITDLKFFYQHDDEYQIQIDNITLIRGSTLQLTGDSGIGKSTVLMLILNLLEPNTGEIVYYDNEENIIPPLHPNKIELVTNEEPVFGNDIEEYLQKYRSVPLNTSNVSKLFTKLGMEYVWNEKDAINPNSLSLGEKQRLKLIRALSNEDIELLVLDEAVSNLDSKNKEIVSNLLNNLSENISIIIVSHDNSLDLIIDQKCKIQKVRNK